MENSYSIQGYTIEGLSRLQNTRHEIAIEAKEKPTRKTRKTGLENKNSKLTAEQIEWLKANFATTRREDLAKVLNVTSRTVGNYARRYNLVKDMAIVREWTSVGLKKGNSKEGRAKHRATMTALIAQEKRRILYGLEQKTKYKLGSNPSRKSLKANMKRKHGYVSENGSNVIYYTDTTRRSAVQEQHAVALGFEIRKLHSIYKF